MLLRANRAEIHRIEQQDDFLLAAIIRKLDLVLVLIHQFKFRRRLADLQRGVFHG